MGSTVANDRSDLEKLSDPFNNLLVTREYLEISQRNIQWYSRVWQIAAYTQTVNATLKLCDNIGAFVIGAASNKIAVDYFDEMIDTEGTVND